MAIKRQRAREWPNKAAAVADHAVDGLAAIALEAASMSGQARAISGLAEGRSKSCGCQRPGGLKTHGRSKTAEHQIWSQMKARCLNQRSANWPSYGGRGITICDEWRNSFEQFMSDMGPRPSKRHSVDRIDNGRGYSPDNCRWATLTQQARNTRSNRMIEYGGCSRPLAEWAELLPICIEASALSHRLDKLKWPVAKAFTEPVNPAPLRVGRNPR
jgi:hypothetical protein